MKGFIFLILILSVKTVIFSETNEALLKKIENRYSSIKSFSATFSEKIIPVLGEPQTFEGKLDIERPHNLKMEITNPEKELIYYDGKIAWVYFPDAHYCLKYKTLKDSSISRIVDYIFSPFKTLTVDTFYNDTGFIFVNFSSLKDNAILKNIELKLTKNMILPVSLILKDKTGNKTEYNFFRVKVNSKEKINFTFTPPSGTDIIEQ